MSSPPSPLPPTLITLLSLPSEILSSILSRLPLPDRARFASVSAASRSLSLSPPPPPLPPSLPFLFLYSPYSFFDLSTSRSYSNLPFPLSDNPNLIVIASSSNDGFLLTVSAHHHLHLIEPFAPRSRSSPIPLPPLFPPSQCPSSHVDILALYSKAVVRGGGSAGSRRFSVVVLVNSEPRRRIAFLRDGSTCWRFLEENSTTRSRYCDVAMCGENRVLGLEFGGRVNVWDVEDGSYALPRLRWRVEGGRPRDCIFVQRYLVVSKEGEVVMMVWRWLYEMKFRVFRLEVGGRRWVEMVGSLGDHVLFLSRFSSVAVDAREFEEGLLIRERIYYLDKEEGWRCFVYDFVGKRVVEMVCEQQGDVRPPIWVMPSLQ